MVPGKHRDPYKGKREARESNNQTRKCGNRSRVGRERD